MSRIVDRQEPEPLSETEKRLVQNMSWPKIMQGTIYIDDGSDEPGEPNFWAIGSLEVGKDDSISIDLNSDTKVGLGLDIDSLKRFSVTIGKGHEEYGYLVFPVLEIGELIKSSA